MWIDKPDKPGYWLFSGKRLSRSRSFVVDVKAPVIVRELDGYPEWMVFYVGNGSGFAVSQHEGKWLSLEGAFNVAAS